LVSWPIVVHCFGFGILAIVHMHCTVVILLMGYWLSVVLVLCTCELYPLYNLAQLGSPLMLYIVCWRPRGSPHTWSPRQNSQNTNEVKSFALTFLCQKVITCRQMTQCQWTRLHHRQQLDLKKNITKESKGGDQLQTKFG
jgi:hypothetical protein